MTDQSDARVGHHPDPTSLRPPEPILRRVTAYRSSEDDPATRCRRSGVERKSFETACTGRFDRPHFTAGPHIFTDGIRNESRSVPRSTQRSNAPNRSRRRNSRERDALLETETALLEDDKHVAHIHALVFLDGDFGDGTALGGDDVVFHLHRLEDD